MIECYESEDVSGAEKNRIYLKQGVCKQHIFTKVQFLAHAFWMAVNFLEWVAWAAWRADEIFERIAFAAQTADNFLCMERSNG